MHSSEPSSALVARIMHASDNPSPPPSPPALGSPKSLPGPSLGAPSLDTSGSTAPVIEHTEASVFQQHTFTAEEITTSLVLNANSGDSSPTSECEPDLINFSSFSNTPPPSIFVREKDSVDLVEDLLSPSTCNQDSGAHTLAEVGIRPNQPNIVGQDRAISPPSERQQETSCNTVFVDCVHGHSSPLIPPLDSSPKSPPNADSEPPLDSTQTKPVRRSSRQSQAPLRVPMPLVRSPTPRRPALTPLPNTMHSQVNLVVAETGTVPKVKEIGLPTQLQESDEGLVSANVGDQIRSNGEIRQPSPADTVIESHSGRKSRRKTKGNASSSAAELVSLSPSSTSILNDLFQSNSPPRVSSTINAVELTVHRPTTPPFPIVQTSSRPSTPQPVSPSKPADLTRTPARRIPIAEAIVQGTFSPQKPFSAVAGKLGIGQKVAAGRLNSPAFRRVPLDDPTRTPARRVPIAEASSAANSPSKGDILSLNHPVSRGAFPRSRSVELQPPIIQSKGRSASLEPPSRAHPLSFALRKKSSSQGESNTVELASLPFPIRPTASTSIPTIQEVGEEPELPRISSSPAKPTYALRQGSTSTESRIPRIGAKPYSRPTPKVPKTVAGNTNSKLSAPTSKPVKNGVSESWTVSFVESAQFLTVLTFE